MNARLQVEHPVTELVTGLDLVELQLRVAAGGNSTVELDDAGHAIEARINAEDARLLPLRRPGAARALPARRARRRRGRAREHVGTDYDSMIAKVIAHGPDRATALARLDRALADTAILGVTTNTGSCARCSAVVRPPRPDNSLTGRLDPAAPPLEDEQVARAASTASRWAEPPARTSWRAATSGASAACARRPTGRSSVDGGEPLDVVLDAARRPPRFSARVSGWLATTAGRGT